MSTDATVTLAPTDVSDAVSRGMAAAAAQQAALQQLNSNSPGESQVKLKLVNFYGNLLSMRVLPINALWQLSHLPTPIRDDHQKAELDVGRTVCLLR